MPQRDHELERLQALEEQASPEPMSRPTICVRTRSGNLRDGLPQFRDADIIGASLGNVSVPRLAGETLARFTRRAAKLNTSPGASVLMFKYRPRSAPGVNTEPAA